MGFHFVFIPIVNSNYFNFIITLKLYGLEKTTERL